jgi:hypothetical protein
MRYSDPKGHLVGQGCQTENVYTLRLRQQTSQNGLRLPMSIYPKHSRICSLTTLLVIVRQFLGSLQCRVIKGNIKQEAFTNSNLL